MSHFLWKQSHTISHFSNHGFWVNNIELSPWSMIRLYCSKPLSIEWFSPKLVFWAAMYSDVTNCWVKAVLPTPGPPSMSTRWIATVFASPQLKDPCRSNSSPVSSFELSATTLPSLTWTGYRLPCRDRSVGKPSTCSPLPPPPPPPPAVVSSRSVGSKAVGKGN